MMVKCEQLYEGKAKKVFATENPEDYFDSIWVRKDDY